MHRVQRGKYWDNGPFYERLSSIPVPGIDSTPDTVGKTLTVLTGVGVGAHLVSQIVRSKGSANDEAGK